MDKDDSQFKKGKASNIRRSFSRSFMSMAIKYEPLCECKCRRRVLIRTTNSLKQIQENLSLLAFFIKSII